MHKARTVKTDNHTIASGWLEVGENHKIWFQQWGNKKAKIPVITFHGGPGSEFKPHHLNNFNPVYHQVISFDQRGCGNSLPYGSVDNNTTEKLLSDAEQLLNHLGIDIVYVYGGSWGSTLATLFTITNPDRVKATIVNAVFTGTKAEIDHIDKGYFKHQYPEVWEKFVNSVPVAHKDDPAAYHYAQLKNSDAKIIEPSAKALDDLESPLLQFDWRGYQDDRKLDTDPSKLKEDYDVIPYKIYGHYLEHECFLSENYILEHANAIKTPFYIVQGRYDMCCPPVTAYNLHKSIEASKLFMTLGSHSPGDPENQSTLKALIETVLI